MKTLFHKRGIQDDSTIELNFHRINITSSHNNASRFYSLREWLLLRGKGAPTFRRNLLPPLQSAHRRLQFASSVLKIGEKVLGESLVYPHAKLHGITYRNTVILNNEKHFLPEKVRSVWLARDKPARVYGLHETLGFDGQRR